MAVDWEQLATKARAKVEFCIAMAFVGYQMNMSGRPVVAEEDQQETRLVGVPILVSGIACYDSSGCWVLGCERRAQVGCWYS
jgi:hypothetical protein